MALLVLAGVLYYLWRRRRRGRAAAVAAAATTGTMWEKSELPAEPAGAVKGQTYTPALPQEMDGGTSGERFELDGGGGRGELDGTERGEVNGSGRETGIYQLKPFGFQEQNEGGKERDPGS